MRRTSRPHRIKGYLITFCFSLLLLISKFPNLQAVDNVHASSKAPFPAVLSWFRQLGQNFGIRSLEFEIHGASIQVSEVFTHLSPVLPPSVRSWELTGELIFDLTVMGGINHPSGGTTLNLGLQLRNIALSIPGLNKRVDGLEGKINASLDLPGQSDKPVVIRADLELENGEIVLEHFRFNLKRDPLHLNLRGAYDPYRHRLSSLSGRLDVSPSGNRTFTTSFEVRDDPGEGLKVSFGPIRNRAFFDLFIKEPFGDISPILKDLFFDGEAVISATVRHSREGYSVQGLAEVSAANLSIPAHEIKAEGVKVRLPFSVVQSGFDKSLSHGDLTVPGGGMVRIDRVQWQSNNWRNLSLPVAFVQGTIVMGPTKLPLWGGSVIVEKGEIQNPFRKTMEVVLGLTLDGLDISKASKSLIPFAFHGHLEGRFSEIRFSRERLQTRGSVVIHTLGGEIELTNIHGSTPLFPDRKVSMDLFFKNVILADVPFESLSLAAMADWRFSGTMGLDFGGGAATAQATEKQVRLQLKGLSFSSPDESKLGEGIRGEIQANLSLPTQDDGTASLQGDMGLDGGEILLGSFYLNLEEDPLYVSSSGTYNPQSFRLSSLSIHLRAPTFGEGTLTFLPPSMGDQGGDVEVTLGPIANKRALDLFVKEPFGHVSPLVKELSINGETFITATIRGTRGRYLIQGLVETSPMDVVAPTHQVTAKGLKIRFPLVLVYPEDDRRGSYVGLKDPLTGFIKGDSIEWRSQRWEHLNVQMTLTEDSLLFSQRMKFPMWGGAIVLEGAQIRNPFGKKMEIALGLRMEEVNFSSVTELFLPFTLPGFLEGSFSTVELSEESLETQGTLTIHTLGGHIEVANIHGRIPFSRLRKVSMDMRLRNIDLEKASQSFEFGRMGGIIQGKIEDLTLSFGQPEKFEFEIWSERQRGIKQYVNADAVNSLSILSTGSAFPFKRGALQFFKYFPYARLGIYCKLQNDVFTLRGTIHRGGVEYLIKRGLVGGINVINQNPENRIRWKQMLRRLKAIGQGSKDVKISTTK
jgi:hypothetical protein